MYLLSVSLVGSTAPDDKYPIGVCYCCPLTPSMLHGFHQASLKRAAPLHHCVTAGHLGHIPAFLAAGCTINDQDFYGSTPLHAAAQCSDEDEMVKAVEALKGHGADPGITDNDRRTPIRMLQFQEATCGVPDPRRFSAQVRRFRAMMKAWHE